MAHRRSDNEPGNPGFDSVLLGARLQFGRYTLDLHRHALFHGMDRVHLTPRPLHVLEILIRRPGEVVPKKDLLNAVWKDEFVTDDVLVQAVGEIRRVLEDDKDDPAFVQTVPREGYRFIAQVAVELTGSAHEQPAALRPDVRMAGEVHSRRSLIVNSTIDRLRWGIVILAVLIGGAYAVYWWRFRPSAMEWSQPRLIAHIAGSPHSPSLSPDGRGIAYVNAVDGVDQVFVRELGQAAATQLTLGDTPAASPRWSPKGEQILFSRTGVLSIPLYGRHSIWSVPVRGGQPHMISDDGRNPAWSPDGSRIVFERGSDIWIADADGGNQRRLEGVPSSENLLADRTPSFSRDGFWIAFFHPETGPKGDFWTIPANGGQPRRLTFDVCQGDTPVWSRDGKRLLFASERSGVSALWKVPIGGGKPLPVFSATGEDRDPDISQDGSRLIFTNTRNQFVLTLLDPATGGLRELAQARNNMTHPMFDPQGRRIALFIQDRERGTDSLYTIGLTGTNLSPVARGESGATFPHWSGDGTHLYYYEILPSRSFRKLPANGGPSSEIVAGWKWEVNYGARVDSSQKLIVYSQQHAGVPVRTVIRDISTGKERVLARALDDPRWSRDDRLIVGVDYAAAKPPEGQISVCPADGGACREIAKGYMPVWSANSNFIYFLRKGELHDGAELWILSLSARQGRKLADLRPMLPIGQYYDVSPRGEVVFVQFKPGSRELWLAERR